MTLLPPKIVRYYNLTMLSIAIQAGGQSTRMGENKALKPFLGRPLVRRVIDRVSSVADELFLTTNQPEDFTFLNLPLYKDIKPGRGPLGGLYTALVSAKYSTVAVVACDMPFASAPLLLAAADILSRENMDVVIAEAAEGFEPLHAVYRRETCIPAIESSIEADQWRVISWFPKVNVRRLTTDELGRFDPEGLAFWNVNTPEEFSKAEERASR
jgi:molybdopterin-guanine dinucleotide biosynthesis protein A